MEPRHKSGGFNWLSTTEPSSADGNSSGLEEDEEEMGRGAEAQVVPQTPDQEAFLKEHFVTLAELSNPGSLSSIRTNQRDQMFRPSLTGPLMDF